VLDGVDLDIHPGEFLTLVGPSGCGKSTLLRIIAGLEIQSAGTVSIAGRPVDHLRPSERDVAMVFQSYALYPHMSVAQNIAYPLKKRGVGRAERDVRVAAVAATLQLGALLDRKPRQLSGGQQQRVALGRALVRDPRVFLLDEPLSNLDAKLRAHMRAELIELHRRIGKTMVYVTHDQLEAMTMSDRIAVMHDGMLQQFGAPKEVYETPANLFVASFIGSPGMNLVKGELRAAGSGLAFVRGDLSLPVAQGGTAGAAITLGVRPEDITLGAGPFACTVRVVEPTGHETIVMAEAAGETLVARAAPDSQLVPGQVVPFAVRAARLHAFDSDGRRLPLVFASSNGA
jgi:multiple sugar transport system ATP-binding protein